MTACAYNGCTGTIEDGYCSVCGLAPAKQGPSAAVPQGSAPASVTGSARSVRSVPLGVPGASTRTGASSGRASRGWLGAGLVEVPPVPARDPSSAVLVEAGVAEQIVFASCDLARVRSLQEAWRFLANRRPDSYGALMRNPE